MKLLEHKEKEINEYEKVLKEIENFVETKSFYHKVIGKKFNIIGFENNKVICINEENKETQFIIINLLKKIW